MSKEFSLPTSDPGLSVFTILKNETGKYWNGTEFEAFNADHYSDYVRTSADGVGEDGSTGNYYDSVPAAITTAMIITAVFYDSDNSTPAPGMQLLGTRHVFWTGSAVDVPNTEELNP